MHGDTVLYALISYCNTIVYDILTHHNELCCRYSASQGISHHTVTAFYFKEALAVITHKLGAVGSSHFPSGNFGAGTRLERFLRTILACMPMLLVTHDRLVTTHICVPLIMQTNPIKIKHCIQQQPPSNSSRTRGVLTDEYCSYTHAHWL